MKRMIFLLFVGLFLAGVFQAHAQVVINEVLFDPYGAGDANGDGTIDFQSDEFVELMNVGGSAVDIGGWPLSNGGTSTNHGNSLGEEGRVCVIGSHPGTFAFNSVADYKAVSTGGYKSLSISNPSEGAWYIAVECATTVNAENQTWGYDYSGNLGVLNGVPYSITASWTP